MHSQFFSPARGSREKSLRKWLLLIVGIFIWTITGVVLTAIAYLVWPEPRELWQEYIASFSAFIPLFILLLISPIILGRSVITAVSANSKVRWNLVWIGFWSWGLLLVGETLFKVVKSPDEIVFTFQGISYLWPLLVCLFLLPIQTTSEELLFRGAIPQTLTTVFKNPKLIVVVSGVMFGASHLANPEAQQQPIVSFVGYSVAGIGWGWVTYKSAGLELAIGAHTINNFYGLLIVGYSNSAVPGSSIWTTPAINMQESTILNLIMMGIWILFLNRTKQLDADRNLYLNNKQ